MFIINSTVSESRSGWHITARQYGEVVLPDACTGQGPGTLATKLSRCKEGMAHFLPSGYKFYWALRVSRYKFDRSREFIPGYKVNCGHWRSVAVQFVSEPENCHGTGFWLRADERVRVEEPLPICLEGRSKSKKCDKQLTHIVRVTVSILLKLSFGEQFKERIIDIVISCP
jgi:hypothetical protein